MDIYYVTLLSLFLIWVSLFLRFLFHQNKPSGAAPLPPEKAGWPFVGESLELLSAGWKGHPEKFILDRIAKYSSQVFKTHLVGDYAAVFCGANGNMFLFSNENKVVQVWFPSSANKIFPFSTQSSANEEAIKIRKMLHNFKPEALQRYVRIMDHIAQRHFDGGWENKQEVLVYPLAKEYTFWLACKLFVSVEDPHHVNKFAGPFNILAAGFISVPIDLPRTPFNMAIKDSKFIRNELLSIIKQQKIDLVEGKVL